MPARSQPINLLPTSGFEDSFWGKFLHWAVTSGRYIIIATELVVILAFLSRFKFDQDLATINNTIEGQKLLLTRQQPLEKEFRYIQSRLETTDLMIGRQVVSKDRFDRLLMSLPTTIKLSGVQFEKSEIRVQAITLSEQAIGEFLARVKQDTYWKELEMTEFMTDDGYEIKFTLVMRT